MATVVVTPQGYFEEVGTEIVVTPQGIYESNNVAAPTNLRFEEVYKPAIGGESYLLDNFTYDVADRTTLTSKLPTEINKYGNAWAQPNTGFVIRESVDEIAAVNDTGQCQAIIRLNQYQPLLIHGRVTLNPSGTLGLTKKADTDRDGVLCQMSSSGAATIYTQSGNAHTWRASGALGTPVKPYTMEMVATGTFSSLTWVNDGDGNDSASTVSYSTNKGWDYYNAGIRVNSSGSNGFTRQFSQFAVWRYVA